VLWLVVGRICPCSAQQHSRLALLGPLPRAFHRRSGPRRQPVFLLRRLLSTHRQVGSDCQDLLPAPTTDRDLRLCATTVDSSAADRGRFNRFPWVLAYHSSLAYIGSYGRSPSLSTPSCFSQPPPWNDLSARWNGDRVEVGERPGSLPRVRHWRGDSVVGAEEGCWAEGRPSPRTEDPRVGEVPQPTYSRTTSTVLRRASQGGSPVHAGRSVEWLELGASAMARRTSAPPRISALAADASVHVANHWWGPLLWVRRCRAIVLLRIDWY
jgi:hypothetical protein